MLGTALALLLATPLRAAGERITVPAELQKEVNFWIRVYTEITTSEGFLHDQDNLGIVYRTLRFDSDVQPRQRRDAVDAERDKIEKMLRHLATGATDLTDEEKRIATAFGTSGTPARYAQAAKNVRFQLGQADRFREGLERSSQWETHIAQTLANLGLPPELAVLPHVESSFDPTAYSKVGAAGLWQFMRGTGRRFLRIDDAVDERMDPFRETEAAAQLLDYNYRFLGTWPLAVTAYNHGAAGMRRAADALGTTDIVTIIHDYKSPSFGFASRNFFPSFLAALTIDRDQDKYFPNLQRRPELAFTEVELPAYVPLAVLEKTLKVDHAKLVQLNPAFRPALLNGSRYVPRGYRLRLPASAVSWSTTRLAQLIDLKDQYLDQPHARSYRVRKGVAPPVMARTSTEAKPLPAPTEAVSETLAEQREEVAAIAHSEQQAEPVSAPEVQAEGPSLLPGGDAVARPGEVTDYSVGTDHTIRVAAEETIGHYADWLGVSASSVRRLNKLSARTSIVIGHKLKLDFAKITPAQFEAKRRDYHEQLEAAFFANHRITGTLVYVARRGDSLWNVAQRNGALPTWLVLHYNPDVDFGALRAGMEVVIPKVELLTAA